MEAPTDDERFDSVVTKVRTDLLAIFESRREAGKTVSDQQVPRGVFERLSNIIFCDQTGIEDRAVDVFAAPRICGDPLAFAKLVKFSEEIEKCQILVHEHCGLFLNR